MRETAPWHYVDVPLDEPRYDDKWASDERPGYLVPKIRELRVTLKDRSRPVEERRQALRFLVHLVEDLHMPMHVGENHDQGGNRLQVRFFDKGSNLHSVWDTGIISRAQPNEDRWVDDLVAMDTPEALADRPEGVGRGLGDREPAGVQGGVRRPGDGPADEARGQAGGCLPGEEICRWRSSRLYQAVRGPAWVLNETSGQD